MEENSGARSSGRVKGHGPRHSILDLAPLELECMSVLWSLGEGTVRDIHGRLAASRPRAYTTVMTIMDRLEQKGIVSRHKTGRAFLYRPALSAEEARFKAVQKIVQGYFGGSPQALAAHLSSLGKVAQDSSPSAPAMIDASGTGTADSQTQNLDDTLL